MKKGKLSDLCIVIAGQSPQGSAYNDKGEGIEFHQGKKAFGESYLTPSNVWTTEITKIAKPLDILMSVRAPVGPTNITDRRICIGRGLAAIRCKEGVLQKFILYALKNIESKIIGNDGAVFNSINKAQIEALPVPIIPLSEQERIVSLLDAQFAKIDAIKADAEKQLKEAKALFQSTLKDYLTPKEGWVAKALCDICLSIKDGDWVEKKDQSESGIRLIQTGNIGVGVYKDKLESAHFINSETFNRLRCEEVFADDILISRLPEPVGRTCIVPPMDGRFITAVDCSIIKLKTTVVKPEYFLLYTQSREYFNNILSLCTGTTRQRISRKKLAEVKIPIPPIDEQELIASHLYSISAKIQSLQSNFDTTVTLCNDLKQSILKDIFG
ncbi:MAG: restriction endonuclease subunit S [Paludibacteraceae bacterium]|nr:restriction endonuclease subunit S [Paludibacteraceae bacterium]